MMELIGKNYCRSILLSKGRGIWCALRLCLESSLCPILFSFSSRFIFERTAWVLPQCLELFQVILNCAYAMSNFVQFVMQ